MQKLWIVVHSSEQKFVEEGWWLCFLELRGSRVLLWLVAGLELQRHRLCSVASQKLEIALAAKICAGVEFARAEQAPRDICMKAGRERQETAFNLFQM